MWPPSSQTAPLTIHERKLIPLQWPVRRQRELRENAVFRKHSRPCPLVYSFLIILRSVVKSEGSVTARRCVYLFCVCNGVCVALYSRSWLLTIVEVLVKAWRLQASSSLRKRRNSWIVICANAWFLRSRTPVFLRSTQKDLGPKIHPGYAVFTGIPFIVNTFVLPKSNINLHLPNLYFLM